MFVSSNVLENKKTIIKVKKKNTLAAAVQYIRYIMLYLYYERVPNARSKLVRTGIMRRTFHLEIVF